MNIDQWISKINKLSDTFFNNKQPIINLINLVPSKYLTLTPINLPNKIKNMIKHKDFIIVWDCEFQVFKAPNNYKCNKTQYDIIDKQKMIRCISEIGIIMIFNINNIFYLSALFHCGFLNLQLGNDLLQYIPFYHEYMSVQKSSLDKIIYIENKIFPHLKFERIWNRYLKHNNLDNFIYDIEQFKLNKVLKIHKNILSVFEKQLDDLISYLQQKNDFDKSIDKKINKIITNLKSLIYNTSIKQFSKYHKNFKNISKIYLNDKYIQNILVKIHNHKTVIHNINLIVSDINGINIVKGTADITAIINHNLFLNKCHNMILSNNIIDIASYNNIIYEMCESAKLYESYVCLSNHKHINSKEEITILNLLKKYMNSEMKAHNPLTDAYYTLQVFIYFNLINK
jgi:hypothetical protein